MTDIGGYFELELRKEEEYHKNAIRLNTGRNALELILKVKQYKKIFIPLYTCEAILEPLKKLKIDYECYYIDEKLEPIFDYKRIKTNEAFLYTNYFGLKDSFIADLSINCLNIIIDNTQAFFSLPVTGLPTFYSCRKFFGVPDGAYVYIYEIINLDLKLDYSSERFKHLLIRIESDPQAGYDYFKLNENNLIGQPIKLMSLLTQSLLCNIDYDKTKRVRKQNFMFFQEYLSKSNQLYIPENYDSVPMVFPYLVPEGKTLKQRLIDQGVLVATYWPNVLKDTKKGDFEYYFAENGICLPIDQRYNIDEMKDILKKLI
jgi:hypothetical protein